MIIDSTFSKEGYVPLPSTEVTQTPGLPVNPINMDTQSTSLVNRVTNTDSSSVIDCLCKATTDCFKSLIPSRNSRSQEWIMRN